jgi:chromosome partitioning protein
MTKILTVSNAKGGVGKTTTAINLAASLAIADKKILVIDIDPDGAAGAGLGLNRENIKDGIFEIFSGQCSINDAKHQTMLPNLELVPCNVWHADQESRLYELAKNRFILKQKIDEMLNSFPQQYDFIIIDSPPALSDLTISALLAADSVIIPLQCGHFALKAVGRLMRVVRDLKNSVNQELKIEGVLITFFEKGTRVAQRTVNEAELVFGALVFRTKIPKNTALGYSAFLEKPAALVDISEKGARAYLSLAHEIIAKDRA